MEENPDFQEWLTKFRKVIMEYTKNRAPDPFMIWFRQKDSEGFFADDFERTLVVLIDARFDQRTTADKALQNTVAVVKRGVLKRLISREKLPLLIPRQNVTAEKWTELFHYSLPKLHDLAEQIVHEIEWDAAELLDFMLYDSRRKRRVPYFAVKTVRLAVRWLHEMVSALRIDMTSYKIPVDSLVYRVTCRLGIINPRTDEYSGADSPADLKIQSFVRRVFPDKPYVLDEPLWSTGRRAINGGHCFPKNPNCHGCLFESICPKKFLDVDPEKISTNTAQAPLQRKRIQSPEKREIRERQAQFAEFVEGLKQEGIRGEDYREKVMRWIREHKDKPLHTPHTSEHVRTGSGSLYFTHCCARKDDSLQGTERKVIPLELYKATPTQRFMKRCIEVGVEWAIFSDKYAFVFPHDKIPWYDKHPSALTFVDKKELFDKAFRVLKNYGVAYFYYNPERLHSFYREMVDEMRRKGMEIREITHLDDIC